VAVVGVETDTSCVTRASLDEHCTADYTGPAPVIEVKWENYPEVKLETAAEKETGRQECTVKVRVCVACILNTLQMYCL